MNTLTKVLIILNLVMTLVYFSFTAALFSYRVDYKNKFRTSEKAFEVETKKFEFEKARLRGEIKTRQVKIQRLGQKISNLEVENRALIDDLVHWKSFSANMQNQLASLRANYETLAADLDEQIKRNSELEKMVDSSRERQAQAEQERNTLHARAIETTDELVKAKKNLATLEERFLELSKKYNHAQTLIDHYKDLGIVIDGERALKKIGGKVLAVSETHNVIIINRGSEAGVVLGMEFTVYREDKYIGKIRVDKVDKEWSSAMTIKEYMKDRIQAGDNISTSPY